MGLDLVCVGDVNIDVTARISKMPRAGSEVIVSEMNQQPGGSAANVAVAAAKLGLRTALVATIGKDAFAREFLEKLRKAGVGTSNISKRNGLTTGIAFVAIDSKGQRTIFNLKGANQGLDEEYVNEEYISSAKVLYVSGFAFLTVRQTRAALTALGFARKHGVLTLTDLRLAEGLRRLSSTMLQADFVACTFESYDSVRGKLKTLSRRCVVVYSRENRFARIYNNGLVKTVPPFPARVRNLLGANDAMMAGLIFGLVKGLSIEDSVVIGNACKALVVSRKDPVLWEALPTNTQLVRYLRPKGTTYQLTH